MGMYDDQNPSQPRDEQKAREAHDPREARDPWEARDARLAMEQRWRANQTGHRFLGVCLLLLACGVGVLAWIAYPALHAHDDDIAGLPQMHQSMDTLGQRVATTETDIANWAARQEQASADAKQGLDAVRARLAATAKQARDTAASLVADVKSGFEQRLDGFQNRLAGIESSQQNDQTQIASLRKELGDARGQIAEQTRQLNTLRGDVDRQVARNAGGIADHERQLASLRNRQSSDRTDFDALASNVAKKRVDFEVSKHQPREIVPGISLGLNGTNVDYQRINGWVSAPDRRTIWLRDLRTQEPVVLFSSTDGRTHELVITRVSKDSVIGYLVVPGGDTPAPTVASSSRPAE